MTKEQWRAPEAYGGLSGGGSGVSALRYHFGIISGMAMTLRLTPEDERILAALAEAEGVSRHEATLRAIREAAARRGHEAKVAELSARARERYVDVLDRLGR